MRTNTKLDQQHKLIPCQREIFDIPAEVAYLNCAYSAPMLKSVASTGAVLDKLTEDAGIVALPQVRWTDGALLDLELIGRRARELGAALVLDLTQSLGAMPFSVRNVQADFIVCAAYKWLLGPYGVSFLYARSDRQQGEPIENPWIARLGSDDFARLTQYQSQFRRGVRRYDAGEPYHLTISMAVEALRQVHSWGTAAISATIAAKTRQLAEQSASLVVLPFPS